MSRGQRSSASADRRRSRTQLVHLNSIAARLERLPAQREALRRAMAQFGEDFESDAFAVAFDSGDPDDVNRVITVTAGYNGLVNHCVELIASALELSGHLPPGPRSAPDLITAFRASGGIGVDRATTLVAMNRMRNRLQHASPDVQADELRQIVNALPAFLPHFLRGYLTWLREHGHDLT